MPIIYHMQGFKSLETILVRMLRIMTTTMMMTIMATAMMMMTMT